jgi:hypothetical protein
MRRRTFDVVMGVGGLVVAAVLIVAGALLIWAHSFVTDEVHSQLSAQKIFFPSKAVIAAQNNPDITQHITPFAGQQLIDGHQAQVYADHYIANHLKEVANGQTYSEVSDKFLTMKPTDPGYQTVSQQRATLFQGETLRGLLLNAYAFWTMGTIAMWGAIAAFIGAGLLLILAGFGFWHARRVAPEEELFGGDGSKPRKTAPTPAQT